MIDPSIAFQFTPLGSMLWGWHVPHDLPYLDGHFPGQPIVPAVALIDGSLEAIRLQTKLKKLELNSVTNAKFMSPVSPGLLVCLQLSQTTDVQWQVDWRVTSKLASQTEVPERALPALTATAELLLARLSLHVQF